MLLVLLVVPPAHANLFEEMSWAPPRTVVQKPDGVGVPLGDIECPTISACIAVDAQGSVVTSAAPFVDDSLWKSVKVADAAFSQVSCPATDFCVAVDLAGKIWTSANPMGSSSDWSSTLLAGGVKVTQVTCASAALCVAYGHGGPDIFVASNPAGGPSAWSKKTIATPGNRVSVVSCPSNGLCAAVTDDGDVVTSQSPTMMGAGSWAVTNGITAAFLECSSDDWCAALRPNGFALVTSNPLSTDQYAWSYAGDLDAGAAAQDLACPVRRFCLQVSTSGSLTGYEHRQGVNQNDLVLPAWVGLSASDEFEGKIACATDSKCILADQYGRVTVGMIRPVRFLSEPTVALEKNIPGDPEGTAAKCQGNGYANNPWIENLTWLLDGVEVDRDRVYGEGFKDGRLKLTPADRGRSLTCKITIGNSLGEVSATARPIEIPAPPVEASPTPAPPAEASPAPSPTPSPEPGLPLGAGSVVTSTPPVNTPPTTASTPVVAPRSQFSKGLLVLTGYPVRPKKGGVCPATARIAIAGAVQKLIKTVKLKTTTSGCELSGAFKLTGKLKTAKKLTLTIDGKGLKKTVSTVRR